jgi:ABC-2 type transport system ATP-binding protein
VTVSSDRVTADAGVVGEAVITVSGLRMRYGSLEAVGGIDLHVRPGEVFAFLGPNGAGKTTTVEILEGYRRRTAGEVAVLGEDPAHGGPSWRARIGVVLQESEPERDLTAAECLELYAGYYPAPRDVGETLELVGLSDKAGSIASRLSGGQRRRLDVALALIGDPELLFLDEPTTGFDPSARRAAWDMIAGLRDLGVTVFLTTHYMDEAEHLADRVAVIARGQIVAEGTPATLAGREHAPAEIRFSLPSAAVVDELPDPVRAAVVSVDGDRVLARAMSPVAVLGPLIRWAEARGTDLADLDVRRPSLEDIYLGLTDHTKDGRG